MGGWYYTTPVKAGHSRLRRHAMRLTKLKLAGFKSFVDPTAVAVPGQLVGVVGPNGCGKSNIMDAVRWVLGESKASELRGESMMDVIFNGSTEPQAGVARLGRADFRQPAGPGARPVVAICRTVGQAHADAAGAVGLLHQQPESPAQGHHRSLPRYRSRAARLRHHRPGHDLAHHRGQAGRPPRLPRRSGRRHRATRSGARKPTAAWKTRAKT